MAQQQEKQSGPKTIKARVVMIYGPHLVGSTIEVSEAEYNRLRRSDGKGGHTFPVLISQADQDAIDALRLKAEAAALAANPDTDRMTSQGWADYQRRASEILAAQRIKEQNRQNAMLTGAPLPVEDPAEVECSFKAHVAAGRGV